MLRHRLPCPWRRSPSPWLPRRRGWPSPWQCRPGRRPCREQPRWSPDRWWERCTGPRAAWPRGLPRRGLLEDHRGSGSSRGQDAEGQQDLALAPRSGDGLALQHGVGAPAAVRHLSGVGTRGGRGGGHRGDGLGDLGQQVVDDPVPRSVDLRRESLDCTLQLGRRNLDAVLNARYGPVPGLLGALAGDLGGRLGRRCNALLQTHSLGGRQLCLGLRLLLDPLGFALGAEHRSSLG